MGLYVAKRQIKDTWRDKKAFLARKTLQGVAKKTHYKASWESKFSTLDGHAQFYKTEQRGYRLRAHCNQLNLKGIEEEL